jgi:hypothetical protein
MAYDLRVLALSAVMAALGGGPCIAQTVTPSDVDSIGCKSWDTVKTLIHDAAIGDKELWKHDAQMNVLSGECALLNKGDRIVITDRGFASFRFRFDGQFDQYWVAK